MYIFGVAQQAHTFGAIANFVVNSSSRFARTFILAESTLFVCRHKVYARNIMRHPITEHNIKTYNDKCNFENYLRITENALLFNTFNFLIKLIKLNEKILQYLNHCNLS